MRKIPGWRRYRKERGSVLEKMQVGKRLSIREEHIGKRLG